MTTFPTLPSTKVFKTKIFKHKNLQIKIINVKWNTDWTNLKFKLWKTGNFLNVQYMEFEHNCDWNYFLVYLLFKDVRTSKISKSYLLSFFIFKHKFTLSLLVVSSSLSSTILSRVGYSNLEYTYYIQYSSVCYGNILSRALKSNLEYTEYSIVVYVMVTTFVEH